MPQFNVNGGEVGTVVLLVMCLLAAAWVVAWIVLPFAVLSMSGKLAQTNAELRAVRVLLERERRDRLEAEARAGRGVTVEA